MEKIIVDVGGMSCGHCEAAVEGALANLAGVKTAKADSKKGTATVRYDAETVSAEDIRKTIIAAGYTAE